jgi:hypothetical protein
MSILEQAELDNEFILENTDDFAVSALFGDNGTPETTFEVNGVFNRAEAAVDPETGTFVPASRSEFTYRLSSASGSVPAEGWRCLVTYRGTEYTRYVKSAYADTTQGWVLVELTE